MIAFIGSSGYVGSRFQALFAAEQIRWTPISRSETTDTGRLESVLREVGADFVINCAGYTGRPNVDACELHKAECLVGNAVLPGIIRAACESLDLPWGHVSSGCIYTGRRADGRGFTEEDPPNFSFRQNNCSFYSGSKALGEEILSGARRCYIWRMRIPFENTASPRNYLQKLLSYDRLLEAENSLTHLGEFVRACLDCLQMHLPYGVYNLTNPDSIRTSEVTELIQAAGLTDRRFQFFESESQFMSHAARTPRSNCVLDSSKALRAGLRLSPVREAICDCLSQWTPETHSR